VIVCCLLRATAHTSGGGIVELLLAEENLRKSEKNLLNCHFGHHESDMKSPGIESRL
jgi:hypothetical protein